MTRADNDKGGLAGVQLQQKVWELFRRDGDRGDPDGTKSVLR